METLFQKLQRTLELCVQARKEWEIWANHSTTKDLSSTESFRVSWLKEETSQAEMAEVAKAFTEPNLKMKTLSLTTTSHSCYQWQMLAQELMALSFSLLSRRPHGSMEGMLFLGKSLKAKALWNCWKQLEPSQDLQRRALLLSTQESLTD